MDRFGVVGIVFYWGAIGLGLRYALLGSGSILAALVLLIFVPLAALIPEGADLRAGSFTGATSPKAHWSSS